MSTRRHSLIKNLERRTEIRSSSEDDATQKLLDQAAKIRKELAELEGKTVEQVEQEARDRKSLVKAAVEATSTSRNKVRSKSQKSDRIQYVPNSAQDQVIQASAAIERAYKDGITRQTVRFALIKEGGAILSEEDEAWPGGVQEMARESGKPLASELLLEVRAQSNLNKTSEEYAVNRMLPPKVKVQDVWDFDGTAVIKAEAAGGPSGDIQALLFPNTDTKYLKDIQTIDETLGKERLFLLINPFWRNVESWGFNVFAPNGKKQAQKVIFDKGYEETYVLLRYSARGERVIALKVYPYDWQLYACLEDDSYGIPTETAIRLGTSEEEPTTAMFTELLNDRPEFKMTRNMRQLQKRF